MAVVIHFRAVIAITFTENKFARGQSNAERKRKMGGIKSEKGAGPGEKIGKMGANEMARHY